MTTVTVTREFRAVDPDHHAVYPRAITVGEVVSGRLAEIAIELGACEVPVPQVQRAVPSNHAPDEPYTPPVAPPPFDPEDGQSRETFDEDPPIATPVRRAKMLRKTAGRDDSGSMVNYARGAIVTGQLAETFVAAEAAVWID